MVAAQYRGMHYITVFVSVAILFAALVAGYLAFRVLLSIVA